MTSEENEIPSDGGSTVSSDEETTKSYRKRTRDQKKCCEQKRRERLDRVWNDLFVTMQEVDSDFSTNGRQVGLDGLTATGLADSRQNKMSNQKELIQSCIELFHKLHAENAEKDKKIAHLRKKIALEER